MMPARDTFAKALCTAVLVLVSTDLTLGEQAFFAAADGNDAWSGTLPAANAAKTDGPFATLLRAREALRQYKRNAGLAQPVTISVRGGTYVLRETLVFTAEDSGTPDCPVTVRAYPGEAVRLVGAAPVRGWSLHRGPISGSARVSDPAETISGLARVSDPAETISGLARVSDPAETADRRSPDKLSDDVQAPIFVTSLADQGFTSFRFHQLFFGQSAPEIGTGTDRPDRSQSHFRSRGQRQILARHPNLDPAHRKPEACCMWTPRRT